MLERGSVLVLTHINDCGANFDRDHVHWSIGAEVRLFARFRKDYEDTNRVKPDRIW
jgi:hypothetical protein